MHRLNDKLTSGHSFSQAIYKDQHLIDSSVGIDHIAYLVDKNPRDDTPLSETLLFSTSQSARSVTTGQIYEDSTLPDLVYGMSDGALYLLANLHSDANSSIPSDGFELRDVIESSTPCNIRDVKVASLAPCTMSIIAAVTCGWSQSGSDNFIRTAAISCDPVPAPTPTASPTPRPTLRPTPQPSVTNLCEICPDDVDGTARCLQKPNEIINLATQPGYNGTLTCREWEEQGTTLGIVPFRCTTFKNAVENEGACGGCGTSCPLQ